jgi:guanylate kinase
MNSRLHCQSPPHGASPAMSEPRAGKLIVLSGPSGVGKSTLIKRLLDRFAGQLRLSVSATTRAPRRGEVEGEDYYFLSPEEFQRRREAGEFLEYCQVFSQGHWYGTLHSEVSPSLAAGKWVLLEIDVEGTRAVLEHYPDALALFVEPGSEEELERRLRCRATESEEAIRRRLEVARAELASAGQYAYRVVNDQVDEAVEQIAQILTSCRSQSE